VITFHTPLNNNTEISSESYEFSFLITDDNNPKQGDVTLLFFNDTILFNTSLSYGGNNLWTFSWTNVSKYSNGNYSVELFVQDSSPKKNSNSAIVYITLNIQTQTEADDKNEDSGDNKPPIVRFWEAFTSPEVLTVCGILGVAIFLELLLAYRNSPYKSPEKEKERLKKIVNED
jgi:hypothetical protein